MQNPTKNMSITDLRAERHRVSKATESLLVASLYLDGALFVDINMMIKQCEKRYMELALEIAERDYANPSIIWRNLKVTS